MDPEGSSHPRGRVCRAACAALHPMLGVGTWVHRRPPTAMPFTRWKRVGRPIGARARSVAWYDPGTRSETTQCPPPRSKRGAPKGAPSSAQPTARANAVAKATTIADDEQMRPGDPTRRGHQALAGQGGRGSVDRSLRAPGKQQSEDRPHDRQEEPRQDGKDECHTAEAPVRGADGASSWPSDWPWV